MKSCAAAVSLHWRLVAWLRAHACYYRLCIAAGPTAFVMGSPQLLMHRCSKVCTLRGRSGYRAGSNVVACPSSIHISNWRVWRVKATRDVALVDVAVTCMCVMRRTDDQLFVLLVAGLWSAAERKAYQEQHGLTAAAACLDRHSGSCKTC